MQGDNGMFCLKCCEFTVDDPADGLMMVTAKFWIPIGPSNTEARVNAHKLIAERLYSGPVDLVRHEGAGRCFYCGMLVDKCGCGGAG